MDSLWQNTSVPHHLSQLVFVLNNLPHIYTEGYNDNELYCIIQRGNNKDIMSRVAFNNSEALMCTY